MGPSPLGVARGYGIADAGVTFNPEHAVGAMRLFNSLEPLIGNLADPGMQAIAKQFIAEAGKIISAPPLTADLALEKDPDSVLFSINIQPAATGKTVYITKLADTLNYFNDSQKINFALYNKGSQTPIMPTSVSYTSGTQQWKFSFTIADTSKLGTLYTLWLNQLDIMLIRQAQPGSYVTRNEGITFASGGTIAPPFVYQTPPINFGNVMSPHLVCSAVLQDTASGLPLERHIQNFMDALIMNLQHQTEPISDLSMNAGCTYCDPLNYPKTDPGDVVQVLSPFRLGLNFQVIDCIATGTAVSKNATAMATSVMNWGLQKKAGKASGYYLFDLKIFSDLGATSQLPLLELTSCQVNLRDIL